MVFQVIGGLRTIGNFGKNYSEYEEVSKQTKAALLSVRQQVPLDEARESKLIEILKEIEVKKNQDSQCASVDLAHKGVKMCVGPAAGLVSDVAAKTTCRYLQGQTMRLGTVIDVVEQQAEKEILKTALKTSFDIGANVLGAGTVALAITNAPLIAGASLVVGGLTLTMNPELRNACWEGLKNTLRGGKALVNEGTQTILNQTSTNLKIVNAYDAIKEKQKQILDIKAEVRVIKARIIQIKQDRAQEITKRNAINNRLNQLESEIQQEREDFRILQTKSRLARFVFHLKNKPGCFYKFLIGFFSCLSRRFREQKIAQDSRDLRIRAKTQGIINQKPLVTFIERSIQYFDDAIAQEDEAILRRRQTIEGERREQNRREQIYINDLAS